MSEISLCNQKMFLPDSWDEEIQSLDFSKLFFVPFESFPSLFIVFLIVNSLDMYDLYYVYNST